MGPCASLANAKHFAILVSVSLFSDRLTKMLIEQDGPEWRQKLPEIPVVPLSVQLQHREKPISIEQAQARAARAAQEEGEEQPFLWV